MIRQKPKNPVATAKNRKNTWRNREAMEILELYDKKNGAFPDLKVKAKAQLKLPENWSFDRVSRRRYLGEPNAVMEKQEKPILPCAICDIKSPKCSHEAKNERYFTNGDIFEDIAREVYCENCQVYSIYQYHNEY